MTTSKPASAYVHVPFCRHVCSYCAFYRSVKQDRSGWLQRLVAQIGERQVTELETLYFGGGTPSLLDDAEFGAIRAQFPADIAEFTVEANPEDVTPEKAAFWKSQGVNRVSMGVQTFDDRRLQQIGRHHTGKDARQAVQMLRQAGITNLSLDLIYGLPGQDLADVQRDVETFLALDVHHLSIYSLQIEPASVFGRQGIEPCDEDLEADMYEWIVARLKKAGYDHYEISSFARDSRYSRHNLAYWQDRDFYGFSPGASGREGGERYVICPDWTKVPEETDGPFEAVMMGLRTRFGVDLARFKERYGFDPCQRYKAVIEAWQPHFHREKGRLFLDEGGREILNTILVDMME